MRLSKTWLIPVLAVLFTGVGCGTMGNNQVQNAVYDTHRRVVSLDKNLEGSVTKVNENVAELLARLESTEQQMKTLQGTIEENSNKVGTIEKKLDRLYGKMGMTGGTMAPPPVPPSALPPAPGERPRGEVEIDNSTQPTVRRPPGTPVSRPPLREESVSETPPAVAPGPTSELPPEPPDAPPARTAKREPAGAPAASAGNAEADYQQASRDFASEKYDAACQGFLQFVQRYPTSDNVPNAQFWKAQSLQKMGRYEEAITDYQKLRANYATSVRVPYTMVYEAQCHGKLGQSERATELCQQVVKNYPMTPAADQAKSELKKLQGR